MDPQCWSTPNQLDILTLTLRRPLLACALSAETKCHQYPPSGTTGASSSEKCVKVVGRLLNARMVGGTLLRISHLCTVLFLDAVEEGKNALRMFA